jgi:hypothetical protein
MNSEIFNSIIDLFHLPTLLYIMVFGYLIISYVVARKYGNNYLSERSLPKGNETQKDRFFSGIFQSQNSSLTLGGFALTGLALILSISEDDRKSSFIHLTSFFSIGIFFEIFASMLFGFTTSKRWLPYMGFVLEYGGILCLLSGFFIFLSESVPSPNSIIIIYLIGLTLFLLLRFMKLRQDISIWRQKVP